MKAVFIHQISPFGRAGGFHMLCCQGFEVKNNYDFTLGRLAYESLRLVQDLKVGDINIQMEYFR